MPKKLKNYQGHVRFEAIGINVKAANAREAKKKIRDKVAKLNPVKLIDKQNFFVEET